MNFQFSVCFFLLFVYAVLPSEEAEEVFYPFPIFNTENSEKLAVEGYLLQINRFS